MRGQGYNPNHTAKQFMLGGAAAARRGGSPLQSGPQPFPRELVRGHRQRVGGKNVAVVDKRLESLARSGHIRSGQRGAAGFESSVVIRPSSPVRPFIQHLKSVEYGLHVAWKAKADEDRNGSIEFRDFHGFLQDRSHAQTGWRHITRQRNAGCLCAVYEFGSEAVDAQNRRCRQAFGRWCGGELVRKSPALHIATRVMAPKRRDRRSNAMQFRQHKGVIAEPQPQLAPGGSAS